MGWRRPDDWDGVGAGPPLILKAADGFEAFCIGFPGKESDAPPTLRIGYAFTATITEG